MRPRSHRRVRGNNLWSRSVFRSAFLVVVLICFVLSATPVSAEDAADPSAWWVQATAENAPEKFHLLPALEDDSVKPRDWMGLTRDTALLVTYQFVGVAIIYVLPESVSQWSDSSKNNLSVEKWWHNVQNPVWDKDPAAVNYIGHPYFGATYYIRARERGFDRVDSFFYSAFASALYEFGIEAVFEKPSYQDLIVTPIGGSLLGGFVFEPIRNWILRKPELKWYDHVGLIATDPIGTLNYLVESLIGIKSDIRVGVPRGGGVMVELRLPLK
jgi:hypothetical protein